MIWGPQDALRGTFALGDPTLEARACGFLVWRARGVAALAALRGVSSLSVAVRINYGGSQR
jgi:hypothetical protein